MRTLKNSIFNNYKNFSLLRNFVENPIKINNIYSTNTFNLRYFSETKLNQSSIVNPASTKPSKKLIFYYKKIEYQSSMSTNVDMSLKQFLNIFAEQHNLTIKDSKPKKSYQDFEMFKNGRYAPLDFLITRLDTSRDDPNPLTLVDYDINNHNIGFRNITNYKNAIDFHSNKLQVYLNTFLEKTKISSFDNNHIFEMIKNNQTYYLKNPIGLHQLAASFIGVDNPNGIFKFDLDFDMNNIDRKSVKGINVLKSNTNHFIIPLTVVKGSENKFLNEKNLNEKEYLEDWNIAIVDNLDKIRKLSLKYKLKSNFGIVTDFETWKINYYALPAENMIENNDNYHSSLKYNINLSNLADSNDTYVNFVKIIKGISEMGYKEVKSLNLYNQEK